MHRPWMTFAKCIEADVREEVDFLRSCYPFPRNGFFRRSVPVLFSFMPTQLFFFQFRCCYAFIPLFFISLSSFLFCDLLFRIFSPSLSFSFFKNYKKKTFSPPFSFHMFLFSIFSISFSLFSYFFVSRSSPLSPLSPFFPLPSRSLSFSPSLSVANFLLFSQPATIYLFIKFCTHIHLISWVHPLFLSSSHHQRTSLYI